MANIFTIVSKKEEPKTKHLYYYISILHLMAAAHFRNKNFNDSLTFLASMQDEMAKKKGTYHNQFYQKWKVLQALNLNYTGQYLKAISLLQDDTEQSLDCELALLMSLFQQQDFNEAYQVFRDLNHSDGWYEKKMGWIWVLKKSIIEILLLVELDKLDLVLSRLQGFQKKYNKKLKNLEETRVLHFIKLIALYYENPLAVTTSDFKQKVETSFEWIGKEQEDIFVMSFYAWLKAKMEQKPIYEVTLELVKK